MLCTLLGALGSAAQAGDPVTDAMVQAYVPYRQALFQTNAQSQAESGAALTRARTAWAQLTQRFGGQPTLPYERDAGFAQDLKAVDGLYAAAAEQVARGQLPEAHETLEQVRDVLAALRQRNGVIVYSDHMNAYHAAMEHLLTEGKALVGQRDGWAPLAEQVGVLDFLAQRLQSEATAELRADPAFGPALQAVLDSVAQLRTAVRAQQADAALAAIAKVKAPYSKLFLRFG
ncbi:hypothetical protein [Hydrogenophaga sp.]|uniref:hypothetical protein n=1 Tax=Hydrogenophaga sp. TaxID=1904254 RepID=UPI0025C13A9F|nr:hypothetical protein [Hydrogenophaga sp.]